MLFCSFRPLCPFWLLCPFCLFCLPRLWGFVFDSVDDRVLEGGAGEVYAAQVDIHQFWIFDDGSIKLHIDEIALDKWNIENGWSFKGDIIKIGRLKSDMRKCIILE